MDWITENALKFIAFGMGSLGILWLITAIFGTAFGKWKRNL